MDKKFIVYTIYISGQLRQVNDGVAEAYIWDDSSQQWSKHVLKTEGHRMQYSGAHSITDNWSSNSNFQIGVKSDHFQHTQVQLS